MKAPSVASAVAVCVVLVIALVRVAGCVIRDALNVRP
jgi:hypothetical protein